MQAIKSLLAISVLAAAGAANAVTVATYTGTITGDTYDVGAGATIGVQENIGPITASLDDSGLMTVNYTLHMTALVNFGSPFLVDDTLHGTSTFQGTYNATTHTFSINDVGDLLGSSTPSAGLGQETFADCAGTYCDAGLTITASGIAHPYDSFSTGTVDLTGGSIATQELAGGAYFYNKTFNLTATPAVPVPATAWLFGSGLLGLAGTARRRRSA